MLAKDEEVARKVQEEWEAKEEKKRLAEEEATKVALTNEKFLAQQRSEAIRNKPPIRNQLRNQMMTYLKHSDLKTKTFEEIQLNKDPKKKRVIKETLREEDTAKVPAEQEMIKQGIKKRKSSHVKMLARKRPRPQPDDGSDDEHRKCLRIVTFDSTIDSEIGTKKRKSGHVMMIARKRPRPLPDDDSDNEHKKCLRIITFESTIDSEIMEIKSFIARLHKVSSPDGNYLVIYRVNGHFRAFNYLMEMETELLQQMLDLGLEVEEESTTALQLFTMLNRHKNWLVHKQMAYGKDFSNPFMVDNLPKIVGFLTHLASQLRVD
ncbi:hypothetical protein Tco_1288520 [Tanacetum coccineum]